MSNTTRQLASSCCHAPSPVCECVIVFGVSYELLAATLCACKMSCLFCNTLQHTATHCSILQHSVTLASYCNTLQHTATHYNTLQHTATHCNTLQLGTSRHADAQSESQSESQRPWCLCEPPHLAAFVIGIISYTQSTGWRRLIGSLIFIGDFPQK